jgi:hypothetical protein
MTHDKKILELQGAFSPVSLENAETPTQLEMTLEKAAMQDRKAYLSALLEENHASIQVENSESPALKSTMPALWAFGLNHSPRCV